MNRRVITVFICVILLITLLFGVYYVKKSENAGHTVTAVVKEFVSSADAEGYVVKNETEIDLSGGDYTRFYHKNGERVSANAKIASIYNSEADGNLINEIEEIDNRIKNLGDEYVNLTANDVIKVENYIDDDIDKIQSSMLSGNVSASSLTADRLEALFNIKHTNQTPKEEDKTALEAEKAGLEARLSSDKRDVYSSSGGIFAEKTDGFEGLVSVEKALSVSVSEFDKATETKAENDKKSCKIVDNYKWYIMCKVASDAVCDKAAGDYVKIEMPDSAVLKGKIEYISDEENSFRIVTVSTDRQYASLADMRKADVRLIFGSYTGYVVPTEALHVYEGEYGVFVKKNSKKVFKKAEILYSNDEYTVISKSGNTEIMLYDAIIVDGDLSEYYD